MATYYINKFKPVFDIEKKPRCLLYQVARTSTPRSWYLRVRRKDGSYFHQSLEESNRADALRLAQTIYMEILTGETRGIVYGRNTFARVYKQWFKQHKSGTQRRITINSRYTRYLTFFDNIEIHNINEVTFGKYLEWRVNYWANHTMKKTEVNMGLHGRGGVYNTTKTPSATSLKQERQILVQVLRWASSRSMLDVVPIISSDMRTYEKMNTSLKGKIIHKKMRGAPIPNKLMARLMGKLRYWALAGNTDPHPEHRYARSRLYYFILITYHSLLRQGTEATRLKYKDMDKIESKDDKDTWLYYFNVKDGKKQRNNAPDTIKFLNPDGLKYILTWRKLCKEEYGMRAGDDDFIFPKLDGTELETHYMTRLFRRQLLRWDEEGYAKAKKARKKTTYTPLAHDQNGVNITLYSFRHTKISKLLIHGERSIAEVSKMADTSLQQLSNAYFNTQMLADADRYADHSVKRNAVERQSEEDKEWIRKTLEELGM
tara:strand:- start:1487 stop:2947 length:1461 start_codon:yes stop_codon:yes gene_type:complete